MRLVHVNDNDPGFTRHHGWFGFVYRDQHGKRIRDKNLLTHIRSLGIPPAYDHVWICPHVNGHIQATAIDARGRKQYIYHHDWVAKHDEGKFHRMLSFARALPRVRRRIARDLALPGMPKFKILAAIVKLLDTTYIRIGSEEYAKENNSFGLTTLRNRHVKKNGAHMRLAFHGKDDIAHSVPVEDKHVRNIIATCQKLPGQKLFEFVDDDGAVHDVHADDVNRYLHDIAHEDITAKDFRTWHGTVVAASYLQRRPPVTTKREIQTNIKAAIALAADALGNTPTVCKSSYIHPLVFLLYAKGNLVHHHSRKTIPLLHADEIDLLALLAKHN